MRSSRSIVTRRSLLAALVVALACALSPLGAGAAPADASALADYYARKYPDWQKKLVSAAVDQAFSHATPVERRQAILETLAFFHVVYHPTRSHRIENNLALVQRYHDEISVACERFGVPLAMALAILTWENSGSTGATSYAACVGMGQMSDGAVVQAHRVAARFVRAQITAETYCRNLASGLKLLVGANAVSAALSDRAIALARRARECDLATSHRAMRVRAGATDERAIPEANIEDSVVYMRYLLEMLGGRVDLAISAYHNGVGNTDDLLRDYLRRHDPRLATFTLRDRRPLFAALKLHRISYLTLWNDLRCHQMLNGIRTMDGYVTTAANASEAMGDESDIYIWKTLAALAGVRATPEQVAELVERHRPEQGEAETSGFNPGSNLVRSRGLLITRELVGYIDSLDRRARRLVGTRKAPPPLLLSVGHPSQTHLNGVAFDIAVNHPTLASLINEDWLFDRVYKKRLPDGRLHICLNPRYGREYLVLYRQSLSTASRPRAMTRVAERPQ